MSDHLIPADLFARHQTITGLRALADFLETHPGVPVDEYGWDLLVTLGVSRDASTDQQQRAEVERVAALLDTTPGAPYYGGDHYEARKTFGRITYRIVHVPARRMAESRARDSYAPNIRLDHDEAA